MARDYFFAFGSGQPSTYASLAPTFITFVNNGGTTFAPPTIAEKFPGSGLYYVSYGATQTMAFVLDGATSGLATSDRYIVGVFDPYDQFGVTLNAAYALGVTSVAIGTTLMGFGSSNLALGTSNLALGTSNLAIGTTLLGYGLSNFALGTSHISQGISLTAQGVSLFALGTSNLAIGISLTAQGASIYALGLSNFANFSLVLGAIGTTASSYGSTSIDPGDLYGFLKRARELAEGNQTYTKATGLLDLYVRGGVTLLAEKTISDTATNTTKT